MKKLRRKSEPEAWSLNLRDKSPESVARRPEGGVRSGQDLRAEGKERKQTMATVEELVEQYKTDEALQKEVADIVADGKITFMEFVTFARKHNVNISPADLPKYSAMARELGFIK